ncbi:MAG: response regulator transcription factor [Deltaproteobacteria bacterium]|nr:response regulator transcription factor [Deltaproteobacteria bacterium]
MTPIRVLLADDHTLVREGIRSILEQVAGVEVVAEASTGREVLQLLKTTHPDIILMDITMKDLNGMEATAQIVQEHPQVRVLILSMHANEQYVQQAVHAGAAGYLVKDAAKTDLELAIKAVARGETYLSPAVAHYVLTDYRRHLHGKAEKGANASSPGVVLTPREREILQLIAEEQTSKEIAARLHLSEHTVETHRCQLIKRLRVRGLAGLVRAAIRLGLVPPDC